MKKLKRMFAAVIGLAMVLTAVPVADVSAEDKVDHVIVNQVYGGADDGTASHSFIELYNPTDEAVDLTGWKLWYKSSESGPNNSVWETLTLTGKIGTEDYYLIRCGAVSTASNKLTYQVPEGNQEWDIQIHNKGFAVILTDNTIEADTEFAGNISTNPNYVDCLAAQGNDGDSDQIPPAYEAGYSAIQSKKKAVRRVGFVDTDNNSADVAAIDYSKTVSADDGPHVGSYGSKTSQTISLTAGNPLTMLPGESVSLGASAQSKLSYESNNEEIVTVDEAGNVTALKAGHAQITITAAEDATYASNTLTVDITVAQDFTLKTEGFENGNALSLNKLGSYITGVSNADGGVAEIVSYDKKNNNAWVVNGATGKLDIISLTPVTCKTETGEAKLTAEHLDIKALVEARDNTFSYGDMTSVSVNAELGIAAVALQDADYMEDGRVAILDLEGSLLALLPAGCQPDMVTFTPDGTKILTANEGEPRNGGLGNEAADPKGSVTVIKLNMDDFSTSSSQNVYFDAFDSQRASLVDKNVILSKDAAPSLDLEPEYIACDNTKAYVALQEANAIAVLDLASMEYEGIYSLGFKDLSLEKNAVDVVQDGEYKADTYADTVAAYMPDGIALYSANGRIYLLTANEGDAREWGNYKNEAKEKLISTAGVETKDKVRVINPELTDGLPTGKNVMFGGRSFSIYEMTDGEMIQVYDSANDFEAKTAGYLPSYFNVSNDDNEFDSRSQKKGPEPESVTVGMIDGKAYAFVALERTGGIMMYDITDPTSPQYVNYINSRDFAEDPSNAGNQALKSDVAPEGLYFISSESSPSGTPILLAAFEVSGTVAAYSVGCEPSGHVDANNDGKCDKCGLQLKENEDHPEQKPGAGEDGSQASGNDQGDQEISISGNGQKGPKTGDTANMNVWFLGVCGSLLVLGVVIGKKRNRYGR